MAIGDLVAGQVTDVVYDGTDLVLQDTILVSGGCGVTHNTTQASGVAAYAVKFNTENYDTASIHDNVTNNTRLTVPAGITKIRLQGHISAVGTGANGILILRIRKNGVTNIAEGANVTFGVNPLSGDVISQLQTVSTGDYFELIADTSAGTAGLNISANIGASFEMILVE